MAPALTSNSFRLYSKPTRPATVASAQPRPNLFSFGRPKEDPSAPGDEAPKPNRFFVDFGKLPDAKSLVPAIATGPSTPFFAGARRKDPRSVFVAGATGQAGARIAWALLRQGFTVRAGVSDLAAAQDVARLAAAYKIISPEESKRLNAVESPSDDAEAIAKAIGPAAKVVVTVGAAEKGPTAELTTNEALEVVRAAKLAGVGHVAVVYNAGPGGFPVQSTGNVLDGVTSFFSNLFAQGQSLTLGDLLRKMAELDLNYTVIRAALTDDYAAESSYALTVAEEGKAIGATTGEFKVSRLQIAGLVADVLSNTAIAENKVVEVFSSPSATSKGVEELFRVIPEDGRRKVYAEAKAKEEAEEAAAEKAREATAKKKKIEEEAQKLEEKKTRAATASKEARQLVEDAGASLDGLLARAKGLAGGEFSWDKLSSQLATVVAVTTNGAAEGKIKTTTQVATVRGQAKARSLPAKKAVVKRPPPPEKPKTKQPEASPEVKKIFGGLFKQETIYIDDD
ncbi:protein PLASTID TRANSCRIPTIONALLY ACTIVE 16, chloroplastic-like [Zingiber officinale]|uniref:protein PLASTID TRANSCRIPTIONALLY ACTIVE 16, chloroplastic-like n=1 Tax=Zingiber officinale TaxID=94328 RepID=UPI001C4D0992|nr:protein PLASTID TRANSCRIPTIONALLY ACTIVE 16, chloroplastic-like [Zingiber officinale]